MNLRNPVISISFIFIILLACNPDFLNPDPDALPSFSTDTVTFDTVFSTIGSTTLVFKVYNKSSRPLLINSITLAGGENSFFRLNIDGISSLRETDVEVAPDDSLYVFVAVTVDPTNSDNPMVVKDSVVFETNGTVQDVKLIAYGQDVHLINGEIIGTSDWINDKPYLIYNSMAVDTGQVLTIHDGVRVFFHRNSSMIIWGTLVVDGTFEHPVVFCNDRLEEFYDIVAGQWGTIYFDPISKGNKLNHMVIKNAIAGIQIGTPASYDMPDLELSNSFITNHSFAGIYAFGADLTCYNTVISNCAGPAAALLRGGRYSFMHCSVSNNGVIGSQRTSASLVLTNSFDNPEFDPFTGNYSYVTYTGDLENADFLNCIIDGNLKHELLMLNNGSEDFNFRFDHCLVKADEDSIDTGDISHYNSLIINKNPKFANDSDRYHLDYSLDTLSPAKDAGEPSLLVTYPFLINDISGRMRSDGLPDLGAFERKED